MKKNVAKKLKQRKRKIQKRLAKNSFPEKPGPMLNPDPIRYEMGERDRGMIYGGVGAMQLLVRRLKLDEAINQKLAIFKLYNPYMESDHVLNIAYNILCNGRTLEDIERLRNDEVYLDALGAPRIPDPTTAGDFCRRFSAEQVEILQDIINEVRLKVWAEQAPDFFAEAQIDADGTIAETFGECKDGMDMSYKGVWGYHPLVVSLANTAEPLFLANRSGNSTSSKDAAGYLDRAIELCRRGGFQRIRLRGDTDFSQTRYLDGWEDDGVQFVFGMAAMPKLVEMAETLPETAYTPLSRPVKYTIKTEPRRKPVNVKEEIVQARGYKNIKLDSEQVAEFDYQPVKCDRSYRVVVLRKNLSVEKGEAVLFDEVRYFFYLTNDRQSTAAGIVHHANQRCNQENLIEQLKNGVSAMRMPVDNLVSNWAYMVMAALAWNLKAWFALSLPASGRWKEKRRAEKRRVLRMEFKAFRDFFVLLPCRIIQTGRRLIVRLLGWNPHLEIFFRAVERLSRPLRC